MSACAFPSTKYTFGVESERTSVSMPTRSMSSRRFATSVIGAVTPKNRAPLYRMIRWPVGLVPKEKSPPLRSMRSKYAGG
jgi:hypothetical protein